MMTAIKTNESSANKQRYDLTERQCGYAMALVKLPQAKRNDRLEKMSTVLREKMQPLIRREIARQVATLNADVKALYCRQLKRRQPGEYAEFMLQLRIAETELTAQNNPHGFTRALKQWREKHVDFNPPGQ